MEEIWKDIKGYEGLYQVSNFGRVRSIKFGKERILKHSKTQNGYLQVILYDNGRPRCFFVHRLVAEAFIPNPNNLTEVNHKDECKTNNRVNNLEWCDRQYNAEYSLAKTVNQYSKNGEFIKQWKSATEVETQCGFHQQNICLCCQGKRKSAYGFKWYYTDDQTQYTDQPLF